MAKIQIKSEKLTPFFLVIIYRSFASFAPHALKGRVFKIYQFFDTFFASKYKLIHTKSTC